VGGATPIKPPECLPKERLIRGRCHLGRGDNDSNNVSNRWLRKSALVNVSCGNAIDDGARHYPALVI
jgi:hypothetical protein